MRLRSRASAFFRHLSEGESECYTETFPAARTPSASRWSTTRCRACTPRRRSSTTPATSREMIDGMKIGLPGMDLVIFPEYSTHGIMYDRQGDDGHRLADPRRGDRDLRRGLPAQPAPGACSRSPASGTRSTRRRCPYNTLILMNDQGEIVQKYRKIMPWCPDRGLVSRQLHLRLRRPEGAEGQPDHLRRRQLPGDLARLRHARAPS